MKRLAIKSSEKPPTNTNVKNSKGVNNNNNNNNNNNRPHNNQQKKKICKIVALSRLAFVPDGCSKPRADSGPNRHQLRLGKLRVGELHFCPLCTALDQASSLSRKLAYVPGPTFGFVKLLASSGSHCTKWTDEQHRQAGFESRLLPDLPHPFIPTLIGLRAFDLVSSRVWWEAATNTWIIGKRTTNWKIPCHYGKHGFLF